MASVMNTIYNELNNNVTQYYVHVLNTDWYSWLRYTVHISACHLKKQYHIYTQAMDCTINNKEQTYTLIIYNCTLDINLPG